MWRYRLSAWNVNVTVFLISYIQSSNIIPRPKTIGPLLLDLYFAVMLVHHMDFEKFDTINNNYQIYSKISCKYFTIGMINLFIDHGIWKVLFRFIIVIILANSFQNIPVKISNAFYFSFCLYSANDVPWYSVRIDFPLDSNICTKNVLPFCWFGKLSFILNVLLLQKIQKLEHPELDFIFNFTIRFNSIIVKWYAIVLYYKIVNLLQL